jgi:hypothetical protein
VRLSVVCRDIESRHHVVNDGMARGAPSYVALRATRRNEAPRRATWRGGRTAAAKMAITIINTMSTVKMAGALCQSSSNCPCRSR